MSTEKKIDTLLAHLGRWATEGESQVIYLDSLPTEDDDYTLGDLIIDAIQERQPGLAEHLMLRASSS